MLASTAPLLSRWAESLGRPSRSLYAVSNAGALAGLLSYPLVLERWVGLAFVHVAGTSAPDDVVFAEPEDLILLGSHSLEGLNLQIDPVKKRLVDAGPAPAAALL